MIRRSLSASNKESARVSRHTLHLGKAIKAEGFRNNTLVRNLIPWLIRVDRGRQHQENPLKTSIYAVDRSTKNKTE
jgi:hypothetical protein